MVSLTTDLGTISYSEDIIAKIAGRSAESCYGIVGMSTKKATDGLAELLNWENYAKGIKVSTNEGKITIDMYVMVEYEVSIMAVASSAIDAVKYNVENYTGLTVDKVNIIIEGIRV